MGRKAGITLADVVDAAATIADRDGLGAASLSAVAQNLGIQTPSLYNHIVGLAGLRRQLALRASRELSIAFEEAASVGVGLDQLRNIAYAYRQFAKNHPGLYEALLPAPKPGEDDELYEAMAGPVEVVARVMAESGVRVERSIDVIRGLRSMLHGFVDLEAKDGFGLPVDIDQSFESAVDLVIAAIGSE